ncbi:uncharacterized protein O3C94_018990 [Discoglossus pictus]
MQWIKPALGRFLVNNIQGPETWIDGERITLYCTASCCPQDVQVTWIIHNKDDAPCEIPESQTGESEEEQPLMSMEYVVTKKKITKPDKKGPCDFTSSLSFIPSVSRHLGSTMGCRFKCGEKTEERTFGFKSIYGKPMFLEPVLFTLCDQGDVQLCAVLQRLYPQDIDVSWHCGGKQSQEKKASEDEWKNNSDNTSNFESKCKIPGHLFKDAEFKVCVMWKHKSMEESESRELSAKDFPWRPEIKDFPIQSVLINNEVMLNCTVTNVFPDALTVKWFEKKKDDQKLIPLSADEKYKIPEIRSEKEKNNTFTCKASLVFQRSLSSEQDVEFICQVEHPSLEKPLQTGTGRIRETEIPNFIVSNIQGPQNWIDGEKVTLYCTASYCKKDVLVTWTLTERDGTALKIPEIQLGKENKEGNLVPSGYVATRERTDKSDKEGLQDYTSSLSFTPSISKHKNMSLICTCICDGKSKEKQFILKSLYAKPKLVEPIKLSLIDSEEVLCSVDMKEFYPKDIEIRWSCGVGTPQDKMKSKEEFKENDLTWKVTSECNISGHLFRDPNFTVRVSWKHRSMDGDDSRQLSVIGQDFPWEPEIEEIPIPSLIVNNQATLMCNISNIFPDNVDVKWLRKEKNGTELFPVSHSDKYKIPDTNVEKQTDNTYIYRARLTFIPSVSTDQGSEFICRVKHPTLEKPKERTTGPLQIKGFPVVKDISSSEDGIVTLDVDGFYPKDITISWKQILDSVKEDHKALTSSLIFDENTNGSYRVTSTCDLGKNDINVENSYRLTATVQHEALDSPISKTFYNEKNGPDKKIPALLYEEQKEKSSSPNVQDQTVPGTVNLQTDYPQFTVNNIQGPKEWKHGEKVTLYCSASYCSKDVKVTWIVKEKDGRSWEIPDMEPEESKKQKNLMNFGYEATRESTDESDRDSYVNITSSIRFVPSVSKHTGSTLMCQVVCDGSTKEKLFDLQAIYAKPKCMDPIKLTLCETGEVEYSLNLLRFYPKDIQISWTGGIGHLKEVKSTKENLEELPDHLLNVQSACKVSENYFKDPGFKVCVTWKHPSTDTPESRELSARDIDFPWRPKIQEIPVPHVLIGRQIIFQFKISNYFPDALTVKWFKKEKGTEAVFPVSHNETYRISDIRSQKQPDNTYTCTACLGITPSLSSDQGAEFICSVGHPSLEQPIEGSIGPLSVKAKPQITEQLKLTICDSGDVKCSLNLNSLYPKDIQIKWLYGVGQCPKTNESQEIFAKNSDETFNVTSNCIIPGNIFKDSASKINVTWKHDSTDDPESKELSVRDSGFPWRPKMNLFIPRLLVNEPATLTSTISNYFPDLLTVTWLKRERGFQELSPVSPHEKCHISDSQSERQSDNSYVCKVHLSLNPSIQTEQEAEYFCQVAHPSLDQPIRKGTGPLYLTAMPKMIQPINVSVLDSGDVHYSLTLQSFYPKPIQIEWCYKVGHSQNQVKSEENLESNPDLTFNIQSVCIIPGSLFRDLSLNVLVAWKHESMDNAEIRNMSVCDLDFPWHPETEEITVPSLFAEEQVTLQCKISNCLPSAMTVTWLKKERGGQELLLLSHCEKYKIPEITVLRESQKSFTCIAYLVFTPSLNTENGAEFICRVDHPGLEQPAEKRTGPLQVTERHTNLPEISSHNAQDPTPQQQYVSMGHTNLPEFQFSSQCDQFTFTAQETTPQQQYEVMDTEDSHIKDTEDSRIQDRKKLKAQPGRVKQNQNQQYTEQMKTKPEIRPKRKRESEQTDSSKYSYARIQMNQPVTESPTWKRKREKPENAAHSGAIDVLTTSGDLNEEDNMDES